MSGCVGGRRALGLCPDAIVVRCPWAGAPALTAAFARVGAFPLADPTSRDAALLVTLPAGTYTAQVRGVAGATGTALVEIYEVP